MDVVDAASDKPIGMTLITTQALLQHQREFLLRQSKIPFFSFTCDPTGFAGKLPLVLELRTGLKNADFFKAVKGSQPSPESETHLGKFLRREKAHVLTNFPLTNFETIHYFQVV